MNVPQSDKPQSKQLDLRWTWVLRVLGVAHLTLLSSWLFTDLGLISKGGIFNSDAKLINDDLAFIALIFWGGSALSLLLGRFERFSLIIVSISSALSLSQLPLELLQTQDRLLIALSVICAVLPEQRESKRVLRRISVACLFAMWAWPSLLTILEPPLNFWTKGTALSFWAWTDAAPTPLALRLAIAPTWLKETILSLTLASLAWGPIILLLKVRLWPLLWLIVTPLCLWIGGGVPTIVGSILWLLCVLILDERFQRSPLSQICQHPLAAKFSHSAVIKWPVLILSTWYMTSENLGIAPFLSLAMYLIWTPSLQRGNEEVNESSIFHAGVVPWAIILLGLGCVNFLGDDQPALKQLSHLSLHEQDHHWTELTTSRSSIKLERSEDGGASWLPESYLAADSVTLDHQPWRPLSPLRETKWLHQMVNTKQCEDGPLMDLFEQRLRDHIKRLNTPPLLTPHQMILLRARRVEWVRTPYGFWREEARGFYCIPTNLVVLLKARQLIKQSRETLPKMPKLAPDPRSAKP